MRATCLNRIHELAKRDPRVVFIGSDLSPGLLGDMKREMPDRHYMEGVMEQNVVGMAAGFAMEGYIPYVNTIATFLTRRCYEQVAVDLCLHDLPVRLIGNGGGLIYAPLGPTHLAIEDMAIMRALPNMAVVAACDAQEMRSLMDASLDWPHPMYIRLGGNPAINVKRGTFAIGKAMLMRKAQSRKPIALMSTGVMTANCLDAADILGRDGIEASVLHIHSVKPLDEESVLEHAAAARMVVTVEEGIAIGGLGSAVTDVLVMGLGQDIPRIRRIALPDCFPRKYGTQADLFGVFGLTPAQIACTVSEAVNGKEMELECSF